MNHIETVVRTQKVVWAAREFKMVTHFDEETKQRYRNAALAYYRYCQLHPTENRCKVALHVGAIHFGQQVGRDGKIANIRVQIAALQSSDRTGRIANIRQQLMAFCRVVSCTAPANPSPAQWVVRWITGTDDQHASCKTAVTFRAPGPVEVSSTAGSPQARA